MSKTTWTLILFAVSIFVFGIIYFCVPLRRIIDVDLDRVVINGNIGLGDGSDENHYANFYENRHLSDFEAGMIAHLLKSYPVKEIRFWPVFENHKYFLVNANNRLILDYFSHESVKHNLMIVSWPYSESLLIFDEKHKFYVDTDLVSQIDHILRMREGNVLPQGRYEPGT